MVFVAFVCFVSAYDGNEWLADWVQGQITRTGDTQLQAGWLTLVYVKNRGAADGLLNHWPASALALCVGLDLVLMALLAIASRESALTFPAFGLILGGVTSNVLDRVRHGYVVDVLQIHDYATNPADIAIALGSFFLLAALAHSAWTKRASIYTSSRTELSRRTLARPKSERKPMSRWSSGAP